jgi:short-subunit dehydrogenase
MKTVLITGCSSGLGAAIAQVLAERGHRVFATARKPKQLASLVDASPERISAHALDVCDPGSIDGLLTELVSLTNGSGPDILINNAGIGAMGPVELMPMASARACLETNVLGLMAVTQAFLPAMRARRSGHIINVSSIVGSIAMPYEAIYVASKHAVEGFSDALRFEVAPFGVNVTIVQPGALKTEFEERGLVQLAALPLDGSPYGPHVKGFEAERAKAFQNAPAARDAAQFFIRIVEAKNPPTRFLFPGQARFVKHAFGTFPDRITDGIKRWAFKVPRHAALPSGDRA